MPNIYGFDKDDVQRIADTVRAVQRDKGKIRTGAITPSGDGSFLAKLISTYSGGYSWEYLEPNGAGYTQYPAYGNSTDHGKAFHIFNCQSLQSGETVRMLNQNFVFELVSNWSRTVLASSDISAGAGNAIGYGTGTVSPYGTVRNYWSSSIPQGTQVEIVLCGDYWKVVQANCPP